MKGRECVLEAVHSAELACGPLEVEEAVSPDLKEDVGLTSSIEESFLPRDISYLDRVTEPVCSLSPRLVP